MALPIPREEYGETFLDACESGDLPRIHDAIASGRLSQYYLNEGLVLSVARGIMPGYVEVVAALLAAGARITPWVRTAVHGEDFEQDPAVIRLLLDNGLDPNATQIADFEPPDSTTQTGGEPLIRFIRDPACAREFLSRGTDPNAVGPSGKPPILSALEGANVPMAEVLVEYGAKLEPDYLFITMSLRWRGQYTGIRELMTKFLLDKGVNPNQAMSEVWGTPLHLAVFQGNVDIIKMLLDAGADRTAISTGRKFTDLTPEQLVLAINSEGDLSDKWLSIMDLLQS